MLTFGISFLWFTLLFDVLIFWATSTFVLSLDDQLSSVHLKNFFLLFPIDHPHCSFFSQHYTISLITIIRLTSVVLLYSSTFFESS